MAQEGDDGRQVASVGIRHKAVPDFLGETAAVARVERFAAQRL